MNKLNFIVPKYNSSEFRYLYIHSRDHYYYCVTLVANLSVS